MIEKLIYENERGDRLVFSHRSVYHTVEVTGLSDVRNTVFRASSIGQDGCSYVGSQIESREIEIVGSIKAQDRDKMREYRREMNRVLNPKYAATLTYEYGDFRRVIDCRVENAPVFSRKNIFQDFTVQLLCPDPFWREEKAAEDILAGWIGGFEFPVEPDGEWEIGSKPPLIVNVFNSGNIPAGMVVEFRAKWGAVVNPSIVNLETGEYIKFKISMSPGDVLTVNTGYSKKDAVLTSGDTETNVLKFMDAGSTFIQLAEGDNLFRCEAGSGVDNMEIVVYHNGLYLGV